MSSQSSVNSCLGALIWILFITLGLSAQEARIQILGTTDMHGHILAEDTYSRQPLNQGWAKIATLIRRQQALNPNTILVDCGDTLQGEPINYVRSVLPVSYTH